MEKVIKFSANYEVLESRVQDLLCCALEGGSNYWYVLRKYQYPEGQTRESLGIGFQHLELPFRGGSLVIGDCEVAEPDRVLDLEAIKKGLALLAEKYPKQFADFRDENEDAETGDIFLQLCCFGEAIFS